MVVVVVVVVVVAVLVVVLVPVVVVVAVAVALFLTPSFPSCVLFIVWRGTASNCGIIHNPSEVWPTKPPVTHSVSPSLTFTSELGLDSGFSALEFLVVVPGRVSAAAPVPILGADLRSLCRVLSDAGNQAPHAMS
jgi:hypothetical protein